MMGKFARFDRFMQKHLFNRSIEIPIEHQRRWRHPGYIQIDEAEEIFHVDFKHTIYECIAMHIVADWNHKLVDGDIVSVYEWLRHCDSSITDDNSRLPAFCFRATEWLANKAGCDFVIFGTRSGNEDWGWLRHYVEKQATVEEFEIVTRVCEREIG